MAGIFDLPLVGGGSDNTITRVVSTGLEAFGHLTPSQSRNDVTTTIGTIVSAAGFPEVGIPIIVGGYLLRWLTETGAEAQARA
jgi:hypothetical protein